MPYCPKCDMEFVEGISVCSDCGGPLLASQEEARILKEEQEKKAMEEFLVQMKEAGFSLENGADSEGNPLADTSYAERDLPDDEILSQAQEKRQPKPPSSVYVKKSERYQDMQSSASAFLLTGSAAILLSALTFTGILPITGSSKITFGALLGLMGIACLVVSFKTKKDAKGLKAEAETENQKTRELITWFLQTHSAEEIDQKLAEEPGGDKDCTPEELSLKRFSLIQDFLAVEQDLPDQSYIDALSEEIYARMFE